MSENWTTHELDTQGASLSMLSREWLLTNGTGAFAMGSVPGVNTRRYHALLIAASKPPLGRVVALNQVHDRLVLRHGDEPAQTFELANLAFDNEHGQRVYAPRGFELLEYFTRGLTVGWRYRLPWNDASITVTRELELHWKQQAVTLRWAVEGLPNDGATAASLLISPMVTLRDFHSLLQQHHAGDFACNVREQEVTLSRAGHSLTLQCVGSRFVQAGDWWRSVLYSVERERGLDFKEDYFVPGWFEVPLKGSEASASLTAVLGSSPLRLQGLGGRIETLENMDQVLQASLGGSSRGKAKAASLVDEAIRKALVIAADDFVVGRTLRGEPGTTIIAGYPWFSDWGRDTFIALPGLLLCTGRFDEARQTLSVFANAVKDGLVPNCFDDRDDHAAHYNTVDASLHFIRAALQYFEATGDKATWRDTLAPAAVSIVSAYLQGTQFGIRVAGDGLVTAGHADTQLTWMDAAAHAPGSGQRVVFTPRCGKAVEINALWYDVLIWLGEQLPASFKSEAAHYSKLAARVKRAFTKTFWNEGTECLSDVVYENAQGIEQPDGSLRPNQIFAASLPNSPLPLARRKDVLRVVQQRLLTPMGLRTLATDDARYHGYYAGGPFERDRAYHQGTVWPWLIGPYCEAVLRLGKFSAAAKAEALEALTPLLGFLAGEGVGQLNEIHDGDPPHTPRGCPAQAWSVSEVLRVLTLIKQGK